MIGITSATPLVRSPVTGPWIDAATASALASKRIHHLSDELAPTMS